MKKRSDKKEDIRKKIMGLGTSSFSKSYFPQFKEKLESLEKSEKKIRNYINNSPTGVFVIDFKGNIVLINKALTKKFGLSQEKTTGLNLLSLFDEKNSKILSKNLRLVKKGGESSFEITSAENNGSAKYFNIEMVKASSTEVIGFMVEITGLRLAEQQLSYYNKRLKLINEITTATIGKLPPAVMAEKMLKKLLKAFEVDAGIIRILTKEGLIVLTRLNVPEDRIVKVLSPKFGIAGRIVKSKKPDFVHDTRDDDITKHIQNYHSSAFRFVSYAGAPLLVKNKVIGIIGIYTTKDVKSFSEEDLSHLQIAANHIAVAIENSNLFQELNRRRNELESEVEQRKQTEELLKKAEQENSLIFKTIPAAVYTCEIPSEIDALWFSESVEKVTGFKAGHFLETPNFWASRLHPDDKDYATKRIAADIKSGSVEIEYRWKIFDGSYRWFYDYIVVSKRTGKNKYFCIGIFIDINERKLTEESLKESEDKFAKAFKISPDSINLIRMSDGRYLEVNEVFTKLTGYSYNEVVGKTSSEINIWADLSDRDRLINGLINDGEVVNLEAEFQLKDGSIAVGLMSARIVEVKGEKCILSITRDITEKKKAELALKRSEALHKAIVNTITDGITLVQNGKTIFANKKAAEIFGFSVDEFLHINPLEFIAPEDMTRILQFRSNASKKGNIDGSIEFTIIRKDGERRTITNQYAMIEQPDSSPITMRVTTDVTEKRDREKELYQLNLKLSTILNKAGNAIIATDKNGIIKTFNPAAENLLGYTTEETIDKMNVTSFHDLEEMMEYSAQLENKFGITINNVFEIFAAKADRHQIEEREWTYYTKNGEKLTVLLNVTALPGINSETIGYVGICTDITERKKAELALLESESKFRLLFEKSVDGLLILDGDTFISCNSAAGKMMNCSVEELMSKHPWELSPLFQPDGTSSMEKAEELIKAAYKKGAVNFEWIHRKITGEEFPVEITLISIPYERRRVLYTVWRDITERKQTEWDLKESRGRYKNFIEQSFEGIYYMMYQEPIDIQLPAEEQGELMYRHGFISECNDAMAKMYGYNSRDELIGKKLIEMHGSDSNEENIRATRELVTLNYKLENVETVEIDKNGEPLYFLNNVIGEIRDGYLIGNWGTQKDITPLKKMVKELEESELKYRSLVENIDEAIISVTVEGIISYISPAIKKILGYDPSEIIGMHFINFVYEDDKEFLLGQFAKLLKGSIIPDEFRAITKENKIKWIQSISRLNNNNNPIEGITGVVIDIHERKTAEIELEDKLARLQIIQKLYEVYGLSTDQVVLFNGFWDTVPPMYPNRRFVINFYDDTTNSLVDERKFRTGDLKKNDYQPITESLSGLCFRERETVLINRCSETGIIPPDVLEELQLKSTLAVPIKSNNKVYGVLRIDDIYNEDSFSDNDVDFFEIIAEQLGVVLENADLFNLQKKSEEILKISLHEKEILLKEIHHRVKNNLQIISSLLNLQSGKIKDQKLIEIFRDSQNRIRTMALIHEKFYQSETLAVVDMKSYTKGLTDYLFRSYNVNVSKIKLALNIENVFLPGDFAISCGLILNELVSNSLKYAFVNIETGTITITMSYNSDNILQLCYEDDGAGIEGSIDFSKIETLGLKLVNLLVQQQNGTLSVVSENGARFQIEMKG